MRLFQGDCLDILPTIEEKSTNAIVTDPPYPEIDREYGRISVEDWFSMMKTIVIESRRILTDDGSAVFIVQANSEKVGQMRTWLWEFLVWAGNEWNIIQDVYWFNNAAMPNVHSQRKYGLMRPSVKMCIWLGDSQCYRNQDAILIPYAKQPKKSTNDLISSPSGYTIRHDRAYSVPKERGGATPFNLLKLPNTYHPTSSGALGHGAGTPYNLMSHWIKYLTRPGDTVLDPFSGVGTAGLVCKDENRNYIGIEKFQKYHEVAMERLS